MVYPLTTLSFFVKMTSPIHGQGETTMSWQDVRDLCDRIGVLPSQGRVTECKARNEVHGRLAAGSDLEQGRFRIRWYQDDGSSRTTTFPCGNWQPEVVGKIIALSRLRPDEGTCDLPPSSATRYVIQLT